MRIAYTWAVPADVTKRLIFGRFLYDRRIYEYKRGCRTLKSYTSKSSDLLF